ncbi:LOW QUALITY PROTEIN: butyrophilin subfamily 1 member A1-like [Panthera onca]
MGTQDMHSKGPMVAMMHLHPLLYWECPPISPKPTRGPMMPFCHGAQASQCPPAGLMGAEGCPTEGSQSGEAAVGVHVGLQLLLGSKGIRQSQVNITISAASFPGGVPEDLPGGGIALLFTEVSAEAQGPLGDHVTKDLMCRRNPPIVGLEAREPEEGGARPHLGFITTPEGLGAISRSSSHSGKRLRTMCMLTKDHLSRKAQLIIFPESPRILQKLGSSAAVLSYHIWKTCSTPFLELVEKSSDPLKATESPWEALQPYYLESAEDMEVRWYREEPSPAVHLSKKGTDMPEEQMWQYKGRTTFRTAGLAKDQAVLTIHNVTVFDNGTFHCEFKDSTGSADATLWLRVAGLGSEPRIQVRAGRDEGIRAECTSEGWYPEPRVEWRDFRGQTLPSTTNLTVSPTGLFAVVSNVTVWDRGMGTLSCSISNSLLQERIETKSHLPDLTYRSGAQKFPINGMEGSGACDPHCGGACSSCLVAGATCLFWKRQRDRNRVQLEEERLNREEEQLSQGWPEDVIYGEDHAGGWKGLLPALSPSLDPDTASPKLALSEDRKTVRRLFFEQELPNAPSRFDRDPCVLGLEQFSAGRYYWEVQVGHRKTWNLGVCLESLDWMGRILKAPQHGLWALELYKKGFWALAFPRVHLHPSGPLHRVGVFLDCDAGRISFYSMGNGSFVYAFSGLSFSAPLRPFFCLWTHDPSPLTICSERQPPEALRPPQGEGQDRWEPSSSKTHDLSAPACHRFGGDVYILSPS